MWQRIWVTSSFWKRCQKTLLYPQSLGPFGTNGKPRRQAYVVFVKQAMISCMFGFKNVNDRSSLFRPTHKQSRKREKEKKKRVCMEVSIPRGVLSRGPPRWRRQRRSTPLRTHRVKKAFRSARIQTSDENNIRSEPFNSVLGFVCRKANTCDCL
jgi:hypothetical protein